MDIAVIESDAGQMKRVSVGDLLDRLKRENTADLWMRYDDAIKLINADQIPPQFQGSEP